MLVDRFSIKNILGGVTQFLVNQDKEGTIIPTYHYKKPYLENREDYLTGALKSFRR